MLRRSVLGLLALSAALPMTRALAQDEPAATDLFGIDTGVAPPPADTIAAGGLTPEQSQIINAISAYNTSIKSIQGQFLQIDTQGARIEGTFRLLRPGRIRFRYNPPSKEEIVARGAGFYILNREDKTYYAYPQDAVPLRQFLDERIDLLSANIVAVQESPNYFAVTLSDETPKGTVRVELAFDRATMDLVQWVLADPSGSELTFSLYNVEKNVEISAAYFTIDASYTPKDPGT